MYTVYLRAITKVLILFRGIIIIVMRSYIRVMLESKGIMDWGGIIMLTSNTTCSEVL